MRKPPNGLKKVQKIEKNTKSHTNGEQKEMKHGNIKII